MTIWFLKSLGLSSLMLIRLLDLKQIWLMIENKYSKMIRNSNFSSFYYKVVLRNKALKFNLKNINKINLKNFFLLLNIKIIKYSIT